MVESESKLVRRRVSIRAQLIAGFGLLLILALLIAIVGYVSLSNLRANIETTLDKASRIRELSLRVENEFLLARQSESRFLSQWRLLGLETAKQEYVSANQQELTQARATLQEIDDLTQQAQDEALRGIVDYTAELRPLLDEYETAFLATVESLDKRAGFDDMENQMHNELKELEDTVTPLANPEFVYLVLKMRASEQAYFNAGQAEHSDSVALLVGRFKELVESSEPADLIVGTTELTARQLVDRADAYHVFFRKLVALEQDVETSTAIFRDVTIDINQLTGAIGQEGEAGLERARARLDSISERSTSTLLIAAVAALGLSVLAALLLARRIIGPLNELSLAAERIGEGDLSQSVSVRGGQELAMLAVAFNTMIARLRGLVGSLEKQVGDRTRDLNRQALQLQAAAEVGRAATSILDVENLIVQVTELICKRFDLYYVGLFLVDEATEWAVLCAGTGDAGRAMLARGHRIRVGEGMIGWSVANAQSRVASEAESDDVRKVTAELPDTRSEAAIPLRSRDQVLGAFTVQSDRTGAFDEAAVAALEAMADQVAVAVDNARLFAQSQQALEAERRAYGQVTRQAWQQMIGEQATRGYRSDKASVLPAVSDWQPEMKQAVLQDKVIRKQDEQEATVFVPLRMRGQAVGALGFSKEDENDVWTDDQVTLLQTLAEQMEQALESARLYQDTQQRAAHERLVGEITARMRRTLDVDTVLQTAVQEMREVMGLAEAEVWLGAGLELEGDDGQDKVEM